MMNRIKLSVIAERFPDVGFWLVDDKYNNPRMWVVMESVGKPLYKGEIPISKVKDSCFVDNVLDGDSWVYVPQYDYRKYISPTYSQRSGRPKKNDVDSLKSFVLRIDDDVKGWLCSQNNIGVYINSLIRKDLEENMNIKEKED